MSHFHIDIQWPDRLWAILASGSNVSPRGKPTLEMLSGPPIYCDMIRCVVGIAARKLNYRFMAAEAFWILSGDDSVEGIVPYMSRIADFSDDGKKFFGAYGPKFASQIDYVVRCLTADQDSRQAIITYWRENPPPSKDIPCTVATSFSIRGGKLYVTAMMRSNDVWLGTPYDIFNFSMMGFYVIAALKEAGINVEPGMTSLFAVSSHLYHTNLQDAKVCVHDPEVRATGVIDPSKIDTVDKLLDMLKEIRSTGNIKDLYAQ